MNAIIDLDDLPLYLLQPTQVGAAGIIYHLGSSEDRILSSDQFKCVKWEQIAKYVVGKDKQKVFVWKECISKSQKQSAIWIKTLVDFFK